MGQVKSSQDWSSPVKTGQVNLDKILSQDRASQVGINQIKFCQVKLSLDWLNQTGQNLFGPKMHLRMEFDSGDGPSCLYLIVT